MGYMILSGVPEPMAFWSVDGGWSVFLPETATKATFGEALITESPSSCMRLLHKIKSGRVGYAPNILDRAAFAVDESLVFDADNNYVGAEALERRMRMWEWRV